MRFTGIFNKDSMLPDIIETEEELDERESEVRKIAEERGRKAKLEGESLIEETKKELPGFEEEERKKLLETLDTKAGELKRSEELALKRLEEIIQQNRNHALDFILKSILPGSAPKRAD